MLLARYGYSEVLESHLTRMAVGFEEIGADAAVVDPKGHLEGLGDFTYAVMGLDAGSAAVAVGVIEMPNGSHFVDVPELAPKEVRGLLAATHLVHYLLQWDMGAVVDATSRRLKDDRRDMYATAMATTLLKAHRLLQRADPHDIYRQTGETLQTALFCMRGASGIAHEHREPVRKVHSAIKSGKPLKLELADRELQLRSVTPMRAFIRGFEITQASLSLEPARRGHKPHVCICCGAGIAPKSPRVTISIVPQNGFDHHHMHAECAQDGFFSSIAS